MSNAVERAFVSLLMELPFYFTLSVRDRHALLSRLKEYYQGLIKEYEREQDLHKGLLKSHYW